MTFEWFDDLTALAVTWSVTAIGGVALIVLGFVGALAGYLTVSVFVARPWCKTADCRALKVELPQRVMLAVDAVNATMPTPRTEIFVFGPRSLNTSRTTGG